MNIKSITMFLPHSIKCITKSNVIMKIKNELN